MIERMPEEALALLPPDPSLAGRQAAYLREVRAELGVLSRR